METIGIHDIDIQSIRGVGIKQWKTMNSSFSFRALLGHLDLCSVCTGLGFQREVIRKYRAVFIRVSGIPLYAEVRRAYFKPLRSYSYTKALKSTAHRVALIEPFD